MAALMLTAEEVEALIERRVAPLRAELERLRVANDSQVTIPEAARRLGKTVRHVQRCLRDGRLEEAPAVGGVRMVRWPGAAAVK